MESGLQPGRIHALPVQIYYTLPNCLETYTTTLSSLTDVFIHHAPRKRRKLAGSGSSGQVNAGSMGGGSGSGSGSGAGFAVGGDTDGSGEDAMVGSVSLRSVMTGVCQASPEIYPSSTIPDSTIYIPVIQQQQPPSASKPVPALPNSTYPGWGSGHAYHPPTATQSYHPQSGPATSPTPNHPNLNFPTGNGVSQSQARPAGRPQQPQQAAQPNLGYPYPPPSAVATPNAHAYAPWPQYPSYPTPPYPGQMPSMATLSNAPPSPSSIAAPQEGKGLLSWILAEPHPGNTLAKGRIIRSMTFKGAGEGVDIPQEGGLEALVQAAENRRKRKRGGGYEDAWGSDGESDEEEAGSWGLEISVVLKAMPVGSGVTVKQEVSHQDLSAKPPMDLLRTQSALRQRPDVERRPSLPPLGRPPLTRPPLHGKPPGGSDPITATDLAQRPVRPPLPPAQQRARLNSNGLGSVPAARKLTSQLSLVAENAPAKDRRSKSPAPPVILLSDSAMIDGARGGDKSRPSHLANGPRPGPPQQQPTLQASQPQRSNQQMQQTTEASTNLASGPSARVQNTIPTGQGAPPPAPSTRPQFTVPTSATTAQPHTTPEKKTSHIPAHVLRTPSGKNIVAQLRTSPAASMSIARSIMKNGPTMRTLELAQKLVTPDDFGSILAEMGLSVPEKGKRAAESDEVAKKANGSPAEGTQAGNVVLAGADVNKGKVSGARGKRLRPGAASNGPSPGATGTGTKPIYTCNNCGTHESVTWRVKALANGGEKRVCDDCGLYFNQTKKMRPKELWNTATVRTPPAQTDNKVESQEILDPRKTPPPPSNPPARSAVDPAFQTPRRSSRLNNASTPAKTQQGKSNMGHGEEATGSPRRVKNTPRRLGKTTSSNADPSSTSRAQKQMMSLSVENSEHDGRSSQAPSQADRDEMDEQFRLMVESYHADAAPASSAASNSAVNEARHGTQAGADAPVMSNKELEELLRSLESGHADKGQHSVAHNAEPQFSQQEMDLLLALTQTGGVEGIDLYDFSMDDAPANKPVERVASVLGDWEGSSPWEIDTPTLGGMENLRNGGAQMLGGPSRHNPHGMNPFMDAMDNSGEIGLAELEHFS